MWDLIVSVPDHCLPFYLIKMPRSKSRDRNKNRFGRCVVLNYI